MSSTMPSASSPSLPELLADARWVRALARSLALDEPYRTAVLLRFFEDLPPRAIAKRLGIPVATVHTRLQRGCDRLRQQLDAKFGERGAWCAAVLPLSAPPAFPPAPLPQLAATIPSLGVFAMKGKALAVGAALVAASALWIGSTWLGPDKAPTSPAADAPRVATSAPPPAASSPASPDATPARVDVTAPRVANGAPAAAPAAATRLLGRVVDADGRSVPGIALALHWDGQTNDVEAPAARSDAAGAFVFDVKPSTEGRIVAVEPGWHTVMSATVAQGQAPDQLLVVAARGLTIAGHVRSADGRALAGARVQVVWPADLRSRLSHISDAATEEDVAARTGAQGEFTLVAASVRGARLVTTADDHVPERRPLPEVDDRALELVLQPMAGKPGTLQGQVVDPKGVPVAGARVAL